MPRALLGITLVLAACSDGGPPSGADAARSVLLITIDTLRADALGAYAEGRDTSPQIDRLVADGVLFEQAHAAAPSTLPSHASILTGLHPYAHGVRANAGYALAPEQRTLAERLDEAGFVTGAEIAAVVLARRTGIDQGFAHFRDPESEGVARQRLDVHGASDAPDAPILPLEGGPRNVDLLSRPAEDITRAGVAFLREVGSRPFFLWLHYFDPHFPYAPPPPFAERYADSPYHGEVAEVDRNIGFLVAELERLGLRERTLLVLTSDHGEGLGDHGEDTHSYFLYQSTMRVPLLLFGPPDLPRGRRVAAPVQSVDVAPTILAWLGLDAEPGGPGRALLPLAPAEELAGRPIYGESIDLHLLFDVPPLRFLREGPWKYVHKPSPELYHLGRDPGETRNAVEAEPERSAALRRRLAALLEASGTAPDGRVEVDPETARQLAILGYVAGGAGQARRDDLDSLALAGIDPNRLKDTVRDYNNAQSLLRFGDPERGVALLTSLLHEHPQSSPILETLLDAQLNLGRAEEALASLRRGVEIDPDYQRYWSNLGELLLKMGRREEAREVLGETVARWPCDASSRSLLAGLTPDRGEKIALLWAGVDACEATPEMMNDLAFLLATTPEDSLRDGARAIALAERAVAALGEHPLVLDTLAAAYAESGRDEDALRTARRAVALAVAQDLDASSLALLRDHAARLERGEPIRE